MKKLLTLALLGLSFSSLASNLPGAYTCSVKGAFINEVKGVNVAEDKGAAMDFTLVEEDTGSQLHDRHGSNSRLVEVVLKHGHADDGFPETITMSVSAYDSADFSSWAEFKDAEIVSLDGSMQTKSNDGLILVNCQKK